MRLPSPLFLLLCTGLLGAGRSVRAQSPAPAPAAAAADAREHYEKGTRLYNLGQFDEAIAEYRKGYEIKPDPVFLFNIAQSYRQLGAADRALFFYKRYLATNPDAANRGQVEERIAQLEKLVAAEASAKAAPPPSPAPPSSAEPVQPLGGGAARPGDAMPPGAAPAPSLANDVTTASVPPARPLYKRWWLWAAVGVVVVGATTAIVLTRPSDALATPSADLGRMRFF